MWYDKDEEKSNFIPIVLSMFNDKTYIKLNFYNKNDSLPFKNLSILSIPIILLFLLNYVIDIYCK